MSGVHYCTGSFRGGHQRSGEAEGWVGGSPSLGLIAGGSRGSWKVIVQGWAGWDLGCRWGGKTIFIAKTSVGASRSNIYKRYRFPAYF